ncbi:MAG: VOC family protein [Pseudonocardiaceae bacterium]|jgi:catechol 2,3-dioxygenase-like lactoylglutathione lyase family enzyme
MRTRPFLVRFAYNGYVSSYLSRIGTGTFSSQVSAPGDDHGNIDAMLRWYRNVVGMELVHRTDSATGDGATTIKSAWVANDESDHRLASAVSHRLGHHHWIVQA